VVVHGVLGRSRYASLFRLSNFREHLTDLFNEWNRAPMALAPLAHLNWRSPQPRARRFARPFPRSLPVEIDYMIDRLRVSPQ
jgi:hypothetical protein